MVYMGAIFLLLHDSIQRSFLAVQECDEAALVHSTGASRSSLCFSSQAL